ncbi:hypothetical protein E2C01_031341 [Portunus trituberculatus]|uniref:Uncharacterized protein n=1 Tax=Portunus trituberculatus TaxID=210409 RepID=A0A5B7EXC4_PORTR|nr:hypothetical protein [Portunus trituberculatus]
MRPLSDARQAYNTGDGCSPSSPPPSLGCLPPTMPATTAAIVPTTLLSSFTPPPLQTPPVKGTLRV